MAKVRFLKTIKLGMTGDDAVALASNELGLPHSDPAVMARAREIGATDPLVDYLDLFKTLATTPGIGDGASNEEVRIGVPLFEKLDQADQDGAIVVEVTSAEYALLERRLATFRWRLAHKNIVEFLDDFRDAPTTRPSWADPQPIKGEVEAAE